MPKARFTLRTAPYGAVSCRTSTQDTADANYTVNHKKQGSTFVIITLRNLDRFL